MQNLVIPASTRTPAIDFDFGKNHLKLSGESYPEDVTEFYNPVFSSLDAYLATLGPGRRTEELKNSRPDKARGRSCSTQASPPSVWLSEMRDKKITVATPVAALANRGTDVWWGPIDGSFGVLLVQKHHSNVDVRNEAGGVTLEKAPILTP